MNVRDFKNKVYGELATITKALANPHRLEIIELLAQGPSSVEYIADQTALSIANASQHLQTLKGARLVATEKRGKYRYYSLANLHVFEVWNSMRKLGLSRNAEVERLIRDFRTSRKSMETVTSGELLNRMEKGSAFVIDVRPRKEYEAGHITSAVSVPQDELIQKLKSLPKDKQIVAYCRGPLCAMADEAVEILQEKGYRAARLEIGYPEWELKGLAVNVT